MAEFDKKISTCDSCRTPSIPVTLVKAAHVPLYGWVCEQCYDDWVSD